VFRWGRDGGASRGIGQRRFSNSGGGNAVRSGTPARMHHGEGGLFNCGRAKGPARNTSNPNHGGAKHRRSKFNVTRKKTLEDAGPKGQGSKEKRREGTEFCTLGGGIVMLRNSGPATGLAEKKETDNRHTFVF